MIYSAIHIASKIFNINSEKLKYFGSSTLITKKKPFQSSLYEISESQPDELVEIPLLPPPM